MYPRAAAFLLLWTIVVVGFENGTKNRSELLFSDEFPVDTRHLPAGYRRQKGPVDTPAGSHIPKQQKIIDDSFYKPYYHQGDMVFLRTTPKEGTPYNPYKEDSEYQKLEISDYRDCNLVCPSIFKNTGPVCAQREKQALYYRFWQTSGWPGTFYDGYWYWPYFKNFRSLCDLREANCRNYFTIENKWEDRKYPTSSSSTNRTQ